MPADRLIHPRAGHSAKVTSLTDMEYRVWTQYLLSADDFGVMRCSAITLQADNDALAARKPHVIQRALERLVAVALMHTFEHQGRRYVYQRDWNTWQKVSYPRGTDNPTPPADALAACDETTKELFDLHPGGKGKKFPKRSGNVPETVPEHSAPDSEKFPTTRAGAPAERLTLTLTANANGKRLTANANGKRLTARGAPIHDTSHIKHAFCGRICMPAPLFDEFIRRRNSVNADAEILDWAIAVDNDWSDGGKFADTEPGEPFVFWKARYAEKWPAANNYAPKSGCAPVSTQHSPSVLARMKAIRERELEIEQERAQKRAGEAS